MLETLDSKYTLRKAIQQFSQHARIQQVSGYNFSFVFIIQSYDCKQLPVGLLHAEKTDKVVLINVFRIGFPVSP